jgi:hypothetical protein
MTRRTLQAGICAGILLGSPTSILTLTQSGPTGVWRVETPGSTPLELVLLAEESTLVGAVVYPNKVKKKSTMG